MSLLFPSVSDEEARKRYPAGWKAPVPYLRPGGTFGMKLTSAVKGQFINATR